MAKLFFLVAFLGLNAHAQIFSLPFGGNSEAGIDKMISDFAKLDTDTADFEDKFRLTSLEIERQLDIMRSDCQEKSGDSSVKQRCFREVVTRQKKYLESSYEAKKSVLTALHKKQITQLEQSRDLALKELDKQF